MAAKVAPAFFGVYRDGLEQRLRTGAAAADVKINWGRRRRICHFRGSLCCQASGIVPHFLASGGVPHRRELTGMGNPPFLPQFDGARTIIPTLFFLVAGLMALFMPDPNDHPNPSSESSPETRLWQPGEPESQQTGDDTFSKQPERARQGSDGHPRRIDRYRIERILGQGGFGLVYLAHDDQLQRLVAIKVPHRHRVSTSEDAEAYLTEARTVANLDHPNIVPVHDVGSNEQFPCYVVSKYIDGTDLATRLKQSRLSPQEAARTGGDGGRGIALRPQARDCASGHQAGQHPPRQERQAVRGRFRACCAGAGRRARGHAMPGRLPT